MEVYFENELYHHGVMGQRWGQQNGPPYPLSRLPLGEQMRIKKKRRLQAQNAKIRKRNAELRKRNKEKEENVRLKARQRELKEEQKALKSGKSTTKKTTEKVEEKKPVKTMPLSKKNIRSMTDEEIRAQIDRRKLERELWKIDNEVVTSGGREVKKMLSNVGKKSLESIATTVVSNAGKIAVSKIIERATGDEDLAKELTGRKGDKKKKDNKDDN